MSKVTIHIGAGKTGSSAIQLFLKENASTLAEDGILVPAENLERGGRNVGSHVWFFHSAPASRYQARTHRSSDVAP